MKRTSGLCVVVMLAGFAARAQDATWNGTTGDFNATGNWLPAAVPTGTAFFGATGLSGIEVSGPATLGGLTFAAGARAFTFATTREANGLFLTGAGIVNGSSSTPRLRISNGGAVSAAPGLAFLNGASAGNADIANTDGGVTAFLGNSTAGNATIANRAGSAFLSGTAFTGSSTAGNASFTNDTGGITQFNPSASAGRATIVNKGDTIAGFSIARFIDALTNPGAAPSASTVGATAFLGNATAGTSTVVNDNGGVTAFLGASTAGAATIVTNAGGATFLTQASSGGTASLVVNAGGRLDLSAHAPGSTPAGSLALAAGSAYRIGVAATGQGNALALSGAATLRGGIVEIAPLAGPYAFDNRHAILTAAQGVSGAFSGAVGSYAFLTPTLSYDASNVYLSLRLLPGAFRSAGRTANQQAVGGALDAIAAGGNAGGPVGAMAILGVGQGAPALQALSGQPYADFGTLNTRAGLLFMTAVGRQMAIGRGAPLGVSRSVAFAEACDGEAPRRFGAWASAIGGAGGVAGDGNAAALTYSFGGTAFGIDRRIDPRLLIGLAGGYVSGTQWVDGFAGSGTSDVVNVALYGSFTAGDLYADALAGYGHASNRLQRVVTAPGLPAGSLNGNAGANQFLGQIETGYRIGLDVAARPSVTPFARLQIAASDQAGFAESGASPYTLRVASQATTSVRGTLGVDLAARVTPAGGPPIDLGMRLGWMHDYADTGRPMTAAFAAAPGASFTVFGASPRRDSAVLGASAAAAVNRKVSAVLGYDGEVGGGTDNHVFRAGVRLVW